MTKPKSDYSIQTVGNALRLLETFHEVDELGVSELSRRLSLHKNNVFRLLATLEQHGYIDQNTESEEYRLGAKCLDLGRSYARSHPLLRCSPPIVKRLALAVNESAHLAVLIDHQVSHIDGYQPDRLVQTASRLGKQMPAHNTALGKVLLACASESVREQYDRDHVSVNGLVRHTDDTITDSDKFFDHLRGVAVQGYAIDRGEYEPGLHCVAAPVYDESSELVAAVSVSGPSFRMAKDELEGPLADAVTAHAYELSQQLGYPG